VDTDPNSTRTDEVLGYVVFEAGHGILGGVAFDALVGPDLVRGVGNAPPYQYGFGGFFASPPQIAVVTQAARDGAEGGWAYTYGTAPTSTTKLHLAIDDVGASRAHTNEQVGFAVFESPVSYP
jgi:hypothetical protein